jgi:hypothetical protein
LARRLDGGAEKEISVSSVLGGTVAIRMETLGYIPRPWYTMKEVRSDDHNLPLYHLALFSRSTRAYEFWDDVLKYSTDQIEMF